VRRDPRYVRPPRRVTLRALLVNVAIVGAAMVVVTSVDLPHPRKNENMRSVDLRVAGAFTDRAERGSVRCQGYRNADGGGKNYHVRVYEDDETLWSVDVTVDRRGVRADLTTWRGGPVVYYSRSGEGIAVTSDAVTFTGAPFDRNGVADGPAAPALTLDGRYDCPGLFS
jgi:hypothetical protein